MDHRGAAETVAVFALFLILCSWAALWTFHRLWEGEVGTSRILLASDFTRAVSLGVKGELEGLLEDTLPLAMYEAGRRGEGEEEVEKKVLSLLNARILEGWTYPSVEVKLPMVENLLFLWRPDGSLEVRGWLPASFEHSGGCKLFGLELRVEARERFLRLKHLASIVPLGKSVEELNSLFSQEGILFEEENGRLKLTDYQAGRRVVVE
ncbi:MAG: hypothetical protein QXF20_05315 [Candidatus Hadarchaeales archaeon]